MKLQQGLLAASALLTLTLTTGAEERAFAQSMSALSGQVTSAEEGAMEGVVVSAKKAGSTITVSVVSDAQGTFRFPPGRLEGGSYALRIRAAGYELDGPKTAEVAAVSAPIAIKLVKAKNLAAQLNSAEWLMSIPGTPEQKNMLDRCTSCHTLERPIKSTYDADTLVGVLQRMASYSPGTTPLEPHKRLDGRSMDVPTDRLRPRADYIASINLSAQQTWAYPLKTLPRLTGRSTHVIVTEYDLPRPTAMPHDVILDSQGTAWYSDFGHQFIGKLDPNTGKATEYPVPVLKAEEPPGNLDIEFDKKGQLWIGLMLQAGIAKFDPKTEQFTMLPLSADINNKASQQAMVMPNSSDVDGKVWMNAVEIPGVLRLDLASNKFETFVPYKDLARAAEHSVYGIKADSHNNLFFFDFSADLVGRIDAKSGQITLFKTPTPNSNPRRGYMDAQDRLWFTEYRANKLAMLDTKTEKFTEWPLPTAFTYPYDVIPDRNGELWTAGMSTDRVVRLDPKSGQAVEYQLPRNTNARRVYVDNATTPVTFWVGGNHSAEIVKVEPLD
jgi:virginiamycin B lyase